MALIRMSIIPCAIALWVGWFEQRKTVFWVGAAGAVIVLPFFWKRSW